MMKWYQKLWKNVKKESWKIIVLVEKEEHERIVKAAKEAGKTVGEYVKSHLPR